MSRYAPAPFTNTFSTSRGFAPGVLGGLLCGLFVASPAAAYLEPGTATYVLQTIVAAFFGSLYVIKLNWQRIKGYLKSRFSRGGAPEVDE